MNIAVGLHDDDDDGDDDDDDGGGYNDADDDDDADDESSQDEHSPLDDIPSCSFRLSTGCRVSSGAQRWCR